MLAKIKEVFARIVNEPVLFIGFTAWLLGEILRYWSQIEVILSFLGVPETYQQALLSVANFVIALTGWLLTRGFVTPLANPRDENKIPLLPYYKK